MFSHDTGGTETGWVDSIMMSSTEGVRPVVGSVLGWTGRSNECRKRVTDTSWTGNPTTKG